MYKIWTFLLLLFSGFTVHAQLNTKIQDTIITGYSTGKIDIKDPKSIVSAYTYDPVTEMYILSKTIGDFRADYPAILSPTEYENRLRKESMRRYFKDKLDAIDGKKGADSLARKTYYPDIMLNLDFLNLFLEAIPLT